jgi:hypothetical protein
LLFSVVGFGFGACIPSSFVTARVTIPARVPVRTFPSVWVVGGNFAEDDEVAEALAGHIALDPEIEVRRVDLAELEPARQRGEISAATVVVFSELTLREGLETNWDTAPVQSCGYYGCVTQYQSFMSNAAAVSGELVLTVYEGPTARVLQRERIKRSYVGEDAEYSRANVVALLIEAALDAVDILNERVRIEVYRTQEPEDAKRALHEIELGHWVQGRALLERAKEQLGGLSKEEQAHVWFNLGVARRFAAGPNGLDEATYQAAKRAFQWALRLEPKPAHRIALERLDHAYQDSLDLVEQTKARQENFRALPKLQGGEPGADSSPAEGSEAGPSAPPPAANGPVPPAVEPKPGEVTPPATPQP